MRSAESARRRRERADRRFEKQFHSAEFVGWTREQRCVVSGRVASVWDPVVCAHVRGRGAGGTWRDIVPMLDSLHRELHQSGQKTFGKKYGVDLESLAMDHAGRWEERLFSGAMRTLDTTVLGEYTAGERR
jgi:hypothetical protein